MQETIEHPDVLHSKSFEFALNVIDQVKILQSEKREFILSKQLIRSGMSIGANIREGYYAESKLDFIHKLSISLKEANEVKYWIDLLFHSNYLDKLIYNTLTYKNRELIRLLIASINTTRKNLKKNQS